MATLSDVQQLQCSLEASLHQRMSDFESQLKTSAEPSSLARLYDEFRAFKETVHGILQLLRKQISEVSKVTDTLEMRHRRKCLLFGGISEDPKEQTSAVICGILSDRFDLKDISSSTFTACHRLGPAAKGRIRPILVRFVDHSTKTAVWRKKTVLKGTSTVLSEFLTRTRQQLFTEARKRFGITNCWTFDGNIFAKLPNGMRRQIHSEQDLECPKQPVSAGPARESPATADKRSKTASTSAPQRSKRMVTKQVAGK
ncbi:uncharacterized protein LOC114358248 [Ostrinia furnacalis]|uniref:uncharacterized protein LOC114358248 n=1 Tax=Ostrinia furnacalis TaxID=93504 RepID=UPI00103F8CEC|nr:uncharacterized protein LOC114358248 [Ostrinia furnacalis]